MPRTARLILSTAGLLLPLAVAHADELWRQDHADCTAFPSECYGGPASQQARNAGGPGFMYEVVDNFDLPAGTIITNLEFWGGQATLTPAVTDGFMIRIYADNNGQVGDLLLTQDVFTFTQETYFTWIPSFPLQGFHYSLNLVQPFTVPAAARYWMSVVAIQPYGGVNDRQWFWNVSSDTNLPYCQQSSSPPGNYVPQTYDVSFVLFGDAATTCYANCDQNTTTPLLTINDFICFQSRFAAGDSYANCDQSTSPPLLTVNDFVCFQTQFASGCH